MVILLSACVLVEDVASKSPDTRFEVFAETVPSPHKPLDQVMIPADKHSVFSPLSQLQCDSGMDSP
ncbi:MAG: hypothetical protein JNM40_23340 [Myxococcales bacterium]|nr:hypothetical protein [Myxococcales bacterium]